MMEWEKVQSRWWSHDETFVHYIILIMTYMLTFDKKLIEQENDSENQYCIEFWVSFL